MTTVDAPSSPDVAGLAREFGAAVFPAVSDFLANKRSAEQLRRTWCRYYDEAFQPFDRSLERTWRRVAGSDGGVEPGPPQADPALLQPLRLFPVSVAHNNLDRLVEVLAVELGDRTADAGSVPERIVDLAHVVDALNRLMTSLTTRP